MILRTFNSYIIINKNIIKEVKRTSHFIIILNKLIKEEYKLFIINNKKYLYNYA